MPLSGEAGRCCLQAVWIRTSTSPSQRCKSTCVCLPPSSRFWLLLPCCSFYRITMYPSQQQYCGSRRHCWLIKGPGLKLLSGSPVKPTNPRGKYLWQTGLKMRSLESLSTKSPFEMTISVPVVCCGLFKGQEHLFSDGKAGAVMAGRGRYGAWGGAYIA